jgi:hypothetical protein
VYLRSLAAVMPNSQPPSLSICLSTLPSLSHASDSMMEMVKQQNTHQQQNVMHFTTFRGRQDTDRDHQPVFHTLTCLFSVSGHFSLKCSLSLSWYRSASPGMGDELHTLSTYTNSLTFRSWCRWRPQSASPFMIIALIPQQPPHCLGI